MSNYDVAQDMAHEYPRVAQVFAILALADAVETLKEELEK